MHSRWGRTGVGSHTHAEGGATQANTHACTQRGRNTNRRTHARKHTQLVVTPGLEGPAQARSDRSRVSSKTLLHSHKSHKASCHAPLVSSALRLVWLLALSVMWQHQQHLYS